MLDIAQLRRSSLCGGALAQRIARKEEMGGREHPHKTSFFSAAFKAVAPAPVAARNTPKVLRAAMSFDEAHARAREVEDRYSRTMLQLIQAFWSMGATTRADTDSRGLPKQAVGLPLIPSSKSSAAMRARWRYLRDGRLLVFPRAPAPKLNLKSGVNLQARSERSAARRKYYEVRA